MKMPQHKKAKSAFYKRYYYQPPTQTGKNTKKKVLVSFNKDCLKRLAPFHLLVAALMVLFVYNAQTSNTMHTLLLLLLYCFIIINVLFADFALRNYLAGRQKLLTWIIEIVFSVVIVYCLL